MRTFMAGLAAFFAAHCADAQTATWANPTGGDWWEGVNWVKGETPLAGGSVRFDLDASYAVIGPGSFEGRRLAVDRGEVRLLARDGFDLNFAIFTEDELINPPAARIGSAAGGRARLTTEMAINATSTVVGPAGEATVVARRVWTTERLAVGGASEDASAVGEFVLDGALASLSGGRNARTEATVGVAGAGRLTLRDGATADMALLRLAVDEGSRAVVQVAGDQSNMSLEELALGAGHAEVRINSGATVSLPVGSRIAQESLTGTFVLSLEGGSLTGVEEFETKRIGSELRILNGSTLPFQSTGWSELDALTVQGEGSSLRSAGIRVFGPLTLTDGATIDIDIATDGAAFPLATFDGGVLIDGASIRAGAGDGVVASRVSTLGLAGTSLSNRSSRTTRILGGATVEAEGRLVIWFSEASEIRGPGTRVHQELQEIDLAGSGAASNTIGWFYIRGRGQEVEDRPVLEIDDGAVVQGTAVTVDADVRVGSATLCATEVLLLEEGRLDIMPQTQLSATRTIIGRLLSMQLPTAYLAVSLTGEGVIRSPVSNGGVIDPGSTDIAHGRLRIEGDFAQRSEYVNLPESFIDRFDGWLTPGLLHIDIASAADHDALEVAGSALLGGTLRINLLDGFTPTWGDAFTVLTGASIDDAFETLDAPAPPAGLVYEVEYTDTAATLVLHNRLDVTRDLRIDAADLGAMLMQWGTADSRADVNADGVVNGADLGVLLGAWGLSAN